MYDITTSIASGKKWTNPKLCRSWANASVRGSKWGNFSKSCTMRDGSSNSKYASRGIASTWEMKRTRGLTEALILAHKVYLRENVHERKFDLRVSSEGED
jgi:hypothetical protein